jgi:hypothetical protein
VKVVGEDEVEGAEEGWLGEEAAEKGCRTSDDDDGACCRNTVQVLRAREEEGRDSESARDDVAQAKGDLTSESLSGSDEENPGRLVLREGTPGVREERISYWRAR